MPMLQCIIPELIMIQSIISCFKLATRSKSDAYPLREFWHTSNALAKIPEFEKLTAKASLSNSESSKIKVHIFRQCFTLLGSGGRFQFDLKISLIVTVLTTSLGGFVFHLLKKISYLLNQKLKNGRHFHSNFIYSIECFSALNKTKRKVKTKKHFYQKYSIQRNSFNMSKYKIFFDLWPFLLIRGLYISFILSMKKGKSWIVGEETNLGWDVSWLNDIKKPLMDLLKECFPYFKLQEGLGEKKQPRMQQNPNYYSLVCQ